jgi:uncharacterized protein
VESTIINKYILIDKLKYHSREIKAHGVTSLGLFGSFVRNTANEGSDIDLLVEFDPKRKTFDNFMNLSFFLEDLFDRKVELVTPQSLSKYIGPHILKEVENVSL